MIIGDRLRDLRENKKLSQGDLVGTLTAQDKGTRMPQPPALPATSEQNWTVKRFKIERATTVYDKWTIFMTMWRKQSPETKTAVKELTTSRNIRYYRRVIAIVGERNRQLRGSRIFECWYVIAKEEKHVGVETHSSVSRIVDGFLPSLGKRSAKPAEAHSRESK